MKSVRCSKPDCPSFDKNVEKNLSRAVWQCSDFDHVDSVCQMMCYGDRDVVPRYIYIELAVRCHYSDEDDASEWVFSINNNLVKLII